MSRRQAAAAFRYEFEKDGAFGIFRTNGSVPIEYFMTSFKLDELAYLSYAKDVNTELNFDYLIQRDIDEERALAEISQYLAAKEDKVQKDIVFLPPLLVAVVAVDQENNLEDYYPDSIYVAGSDSVGLIHVREWPGVLKVTNYHLEQEEARVFNCADGDHHLSISVDSAKAQVNVTRAGVKGARLVVIDGQHRLFALNYLRNNERKLVETLTVPVCLVYPPNSIAVKEETQPTVPEVLRHLFVDVNSTVERVSGHFLTLLSEQTLGSLICKEFCKLVLKEKGESGLGLVEWNTKNHKESLEISRDHTLTSIGVLNSSLEECFKTKSGVKLLSEILGLDRRASEFDFGTDEYDEQVSFPDYFPWRDFLSRHRERLIELINESVTPSLLNMFFGVSFFEKYYQEFTEYFVEKENAIKRERSADYSILANVKDNILFNGILTKSAQPLHGDVRAELQEIISANVPAFARKAIFQKAMIEAWTVISSKFIAHNVPVIRASQYVRTLVAKSFPPHSNLFDERHLYLQDTIFNGARIKVTKSSKRQIVRLLLSQAGNIACDDTIEKEILVALAKSEVGSFINQMRDDKRKVFEKSYRTNFNIAAVDRDKLFAAEQRKSSEMKEHGGDSSKTTFDQLVSELIAGNLIDSFDDLARTLRSNDFIYSKSEELEDEF
jgi:hypothetical protein